jgi:myo-inositol 2-dehydrogenase/D-chiro-inositol 1-dehydrogenase
MDKKINVGVIGAGRIGKIHIQNLLRSVPQVNLKLIADIKVNSQMEEWANNLGVKTLTSNADDIFQDPEIDAVVIASSTDTHAPFIKEAALAGKHIFCEKPIDTDVSRIMETLSVANQSDVKLMIGFNRRFDHNFKRVHDAVISGQIGIPHIIKITSRDPAPPPIEYIKVSGGIFIDMTIHDWDMARFMAMSEVKNVYAIGSVLVDPEIGKAGDIDTAAALLRFENGAIGIIDNSRKAVYGYDQRVEVFGSKGCITADNDTINTVSVSTADNITSDNIPYFFLERYMDSYAKELVYFFEGIQNNQKISPNGEDALQDVLVAIAAQRSFEEKRPVELSEIETQ